MGCRHLVARGLGAVVAATLAGPAGAQPTSPFARLVYVESSVQQSAGAGGWREAVEGGPFDVGERLRTGPQALARLELPWMSLSLSPRSELRIPDAYVLSAVLERGRAVVAAAEHPALKLETAEAEIRGTGRAVVRRSGGRTLVSCLEGRFLVAAEGQEVSLSAGRGTVVAAGRPPAEPRDTPSPPREDSLWPGSDPVYRQRGEPLELRWAADAPAYELEILPVGSDIVLLQRDVGSPPARLALQWSGAFRWRVAALDESGLEGRPSTEGLICVDIAE